MVVDYNKTPFLSGVQDYFKWYEDKIIDFIAYVSGW